MTAYYNEINPCAAQWLRNLIDAGHIAPGVVDTRSIEDVRPADLVGFTQCHFFAGIGIWSLALRLAGWPDNRPAWTGSCPCQPFSAMGERAGFDDERHLWPAWDHLIGERKPGVIFGEQVASKDSLYWIDLVQTDLESKNYAFGAVDTPSAGVGAPHHRQRNWFVAERLADANQVGFEGKCKGPGEEKQGVGELCQIGGVADTETTEWWRPGNEKNNRWRSPETGGPSIIHRMANTESQRRRKEGSKSGSGPAPRSTGNRSKNATGPTNGFWKDADWLFCRDGKWRPVESGTFPLADGYTGRVGRLRAYGNAINAEAAKTLIQSYMDADN